MKRFSLVLSGIVLILSVLLFWSGCGGGKAAPPPISVSISPLTQTTLDQGQTLNFSAAVSNDSSNKGVAWSMSGTTCTGTACGTFTNGTTSAATYNAPASVTSNTTVAIQATSVADTTKSSSSSVVVTPPPSIATASLPNGSVGTSYSTTLQASGGAGALTWGLAGGSALPAGLSLSTAGAISGTPTAAGTTNITFKVTDSSGGQPGPVSQTKQLSVTIAPPPISVSISPSTQKTIDQGQTLAFSATVSNDSGNKGVTWSMSGTTCTGAACGAFTSGTTSGATYNAPASVASSTTVTVQATSIADATKSASSSVVVTPSPSITTGSLANGSVGTAYSATLQASGGAGALTWSLASGSVLPTGLSLSSAGAISGTPTATGTTNVTFKVTDSSAGQPGPVSETEQLSITIMPAPLTITTTSLPSDTVNTAYSEPLRASGGTPPYTWTVASGSSLPNWLNLGGSGTNWTISGTPTAAGTSTFSLTVTDSTAPNPESQTQQYSVTVISPSTACGTGNESILKGQYAFSLRGWNSTGYLATIGSFTADGQGHITAGTVDSNGTSGVQSNVSITAIGSSYSVGSDNRGCATIVTPFYTFTTRFALQTPSSAPAAAGVLQEWEPGASPYIAVGKLLLQKSIPAKLPTGTWVYQQTGIYSTSQYRTGVVGVITGDGNGNFTSGEYDSNVVGYTHNYSGIAGTYTNANSTTGRFTETTTLKGVSIDRVDYLVSSTQFLELVSDALTSTSEVLIGEGQLQSGSLTVNGNMVFYGSGLENTLGNANDTQIGLINVTSSSAFTLELYDDAGGTWTPSTLSCSYSIDSYGRLDSGCFTVFFSAYLTGPNTGLLMQRNAGVMDGRMEPQSATTLTSGAYSLGTLLEPVNLDEATLTGAGTLASGTFTGTSDETSPGSPQQANQPMSETLTVNSDGTFSTSDNPGVVSGIIVSNTEVIAVGHQSGTFPTILVIKKGP